MVSVAVPAVRPRVIGPPLRGNHWVAANGPGNAPDHRRTILALSGQGRIAQRFAIDRVRLFDDGLTSKGDPSKNASYRAYGSDVLAVRGDECRVVAIRDGIPENVPDPVARAVPITPDTLVGNSILLDIGGGAYAVYSHLQPGSLRVNAGDRVRRGQVMALVGNTGNSTEPHLHFHIYPIEPAPSTRKACPTLSNRSRSKPGRRMCTPAILPVGNSFGLTASGLAKRLTATPQKRIAEIPMGDAIVAFRDR